MRNSIQGKKQNKTNNKERKDKVNESYEKKKMLKKIYITHKCRICMGKKR